MEKASDLENFYSIFLNPKEWFSTDLDKRIFTHGVDFKIVLKMWKMGYARIQISLLN